MFTLSQKQPFTMCQDVDEHDALIMRLSANLFSFVRALVKDDQATIIIVRESLDSLGRAKIQDEGDIRAYLENTARRYSRNYLKQHV